MGKNNKIKLMIVDDSALVRQTITKLFENDEDIEVIASASDPFMAVEKLKTVVPDVITLDIEMPRMDGLTFLQKLMQQHPLPVVICSSKAEKGSENVFKALEYGACEIITKPKIGTRQFFEESKILFKEAIMASKLIFEHRTSKKTGKSLPRPMKNHKIPPKLTADAMLNKPKKPISIETTEQIIIVGASTGGTEAIRSLLEKMPLNSPGIVIVQHMPEHFTAAFSKRLDGLCEISVKEAENNDTVLKGRALIAPGGKHMLLKRSGARYYVEIKNGPLVSRHRPSVDVLFRSAARYVGSNALGVILTGMGDDGAQGMLEMKECGAYNIAQDEASCVVYGMPQEAVKKNAVDIIMDLDDIPKHLISKVHL